MHNYTEISVQCFKLCLQGSKMFLVKEEVGVFREKIKAWQESNKLRHFWQRRSTSVKEEKKKSIQERNTHPIKWVTTKKKKKKESPMSLCPSNVHIADIPGLILKVCEVYKCKGEKNSLSSIVNLAAPICSPWSCPASVRELASFLVCRTGAAYRWCLATGPRFRCLPFCRPSPPS